MIQPSTVNLGLTNHTSRIFEERFSHFVTLTQKQIDFYLENPELSVGEIFNCTKNPPVIPTQWELSERVYKSYERAELDNLTPAGATQLDEWVLMGNARAIETRQWFQLLYNERNEKLKAISEGDLSVDTNPSEYYRVKPYTFEQIAATL